MNILVNSLGCFFLGLFVGAVLTVVILVTLVQMEHTDKDKGEDEGE